MSYHFDKWHDEEIVPILQENGLEPHYDKSIAYGGWVACKEKVLKILLSYKKSYNIGGIGAIDTDFEINSAIKEIEEL